MTDSGMNRRCRNQKAQCNHRRQGMCPSENCCYDVDPAWQMMQRAFKLMGGWTKDDQKRYEEMRRKGRRY